MDHDEQSGESLGAMLSGIAATLRSLSEKLDSAAAKVNDERDVAQRLAKLEAWAFRTDESFSAIESRIGSPAADADNAPPLRHSAAEPDKSGGRRRAPEPAPAAEQNPGFGSPPRLSAPAAEQDSSARHNTPGSPGTARHGTPTDEPATADRNAGRWSPNPQARTGRRRAPDPDDEDAPAPITDEPNNTAGQHDSAAAERVDPARPGTDLYGSPPAGAVPTGITPRITPPPANSAAPQHNSPGFSNTTELAALTPQPGALSRNTPPARSTATSPARSTATSPARSTATSQWLPNPNQQQPPVPPSLPVRDNTAPRQVAPGDANSPAPQSNSLTHGHDNPLERPGIDPQNTAAPIAGPINAEPARPPAPNLNNTDANSAGPQHDPHTPRYNGASFPAGAAPNSAEPGRIPTRNAKPPRRLSAVDPSSPAADPDLAADPRLATESVQHRAPDQGSPTPQWVSPTQSSEPDSPRNAPTPEVAGPGLSASSAAEPPRWSGATRAGRTAGAQPNSHPADPNRAGTSLSANASNTSATASDNSAAASGHSAAASDSSAIASDNAAPSATTGTPYGARRRAAAEGATGTPRWSELIPDASIAAVQNNIPEPTDGPPPSWSLAASSANAAAAAAEKGTDTQSWKAPETAPRWSELNPETSDGAPFASFLAPDQDTPSYSSNGTAERLTTPGGYPDTPTSGADRNGLPYPPSGAAPGDDTVPRHQLATPEPTNPSGPKREFTSPRERLTGGTAFPPTPTSAPPERLTSPDQITTAAPSDSGVTLTGGHSIDDEDPYAEKLQAMLDDLKRTAATPLGRSDIFGPPTTEPDQPAPAEPTRKYTDYRLSGPPKNP